jgi:hypothetical protein
MGIEPTDHTVYVRPDGFEGRAEHQLKKHFRYSGFHSNRSGGQRLSNAANNELARIGQSPKEQYGPA